MGKSFGRWERIVGNNHKELYKTKNAEFAVKNDLFKKACELAGVRNTTRMASKWRNKKGAAYKFAKVAKAEMEK